MLNICGHFHIAIVALALYWTIGSRTIKSHFLQSRRKRDSSQFTIRFIMLPHLLDIEDVFMILIVIPLGIGLFFSLRDNYR